MGSDDYGTAEEKIKLDANEYMLRAKGFFLFVVEENGDLKCIASTGGLSIAEIYGLRRYSEIGPDNDEIITEYEDDYEEDDEDDDDGEGWKKRK